MAHNVNDASMATFVLLAKLIETLNGSRILTEQQTKETIANAMNERNVPIVTVENMS